MYTYILFISIIIFFINACDGRKYYNDYTMFRAIPTNNSHIIFFINLHAYYDVNFWRAPGSLYNPIDFVINPVDKKSFLRNAEENGIYVTSVISDIQKAFDKQIVMPYARGDPSSFSWESYYRLNDIYEWLRDLAKSRPEDVTLENIGISHENRNIIAVKIALNGTKKRKSIMIECGIHGREWISPTFATYLIHNILNANATGNPDLIQIAWLYEWYIIPVLNVDGYEYTFTEDRLWKKNLHGTGVDLNRNFAYKFGTKGVQWEKNDNNYCGEKAFSEKESQAIADYVKDKYKTMQYYIGFHAYGQNILLPYGYSKKHIGNYDLVFSMCQQAADRISNSFGTKYKIGTNFETLGYAASGMSTCWVKNTYHVPYVMHIELRDMGHEGFALSSSQIIPTCEETLAGLIELFSPRDKYGYKFKSRLRQLRSEGVKISKSIFSSSLFIVIYLIIHHLYLW